MSLDLSQLMPQLEHMGQAVKAREAQLRAAIPGWMEQLERTAARDRQELLQKIARAGERWPGARPTEEPINAQFPPPQGLDNLHVVAADGSQIYPDRQDLALYYVINIGCITIRYGQGAAPQTHVEATLFHEDQDLFSPSDGLVSDELVDGRRDLLEMSALADAAEKETGAKCLALLDGNLLLWLALRMQDHPRQDVDQIRDQYLQQMTRIRDAGAALAGVIDRPRNANVLTLLRLDQMPLDAINQDTARLNPTPGWTDEALIAPTLAPGYRSACFAYTSPLNQIFRLRGHEVWFFYLRPGPGAQIARVEVPEWVGRDPQALSMVHAGLLFQGRDTGGFPYTLVRAHELAVIGVQERQTFTALLEQTLLRNGLPANRSQKAQTKRWTGARRRHRL